MDNLNKTNNTNTKITTITSTARSGFQFYCHFCGKAYKNKNNLEKHTILCEIIYKTNNNKNKKQSDQDEEEELPSQRRLYQMLIELGRKYNSLEEKVDEMSKWITKKKKKINILEWLNMNIVPETTFDKLHELIQITEEDIEYLFQSNFLDTLNMVFSRTISNIEDNKRPIFTFQQKQGMFYIYNQEQQQEQEQTNWTILSREKLVQFLNRCHRKISKSLSDWKKKNQDKVSTDDKYALEYDKTMSKVMGIDFKQETIFSKSKSILYNQLKTDIKSFVEYEFEF